MRTRLAARERDYSPRDGNLFFEDARADEVARIVELGRTQFIEDVEEIFDDPAFPVGVERMLLGTAAPGPHTRYPTCASFRGITDVTFPE
jgi:hypothetical protein